jgi:phosphoglycolate phosphatase-like HAD superfamily hydrolase
MAVCGLRDLFEFVVCGDQVVRGKPHPEPVLTVMAALNIHLDPTRVLFVGDSPNDLRAGKSVGTKTAAVGWGPIHHRVLRAESPDYFLDQMEDLLGLTPL